MSKNSKKYDASSIGALVGPERVRQRPAAMLGSNGLKGAQHGVTEILGNAIDEASAGYGERIDLTYHTDTSITIRDYGRGVPMKGMNDVLNIKTYLAIFFELYSGGKYETYQDELQAIQDANAWDTFNPHDYNYLFSIGLNGLGAAATQYSSSFFHVTSYRDGEAASMRFKNGYPEWDELLLEPTDEPNGTYIHWKPDAQVFTATDVTGAYLKALAKSTAYVSGLTAHYKNEQTNEEIVYEAGPLENYLRIEHPNVIDHETRIYNIQNMTHGEFWTTVEDGPDKRNIYVFKYDISLALVPKGGHINAFHNAVEMVGSEASSAHHRGVNDAVDAFFQDRAKEAGIKLNPYEYRDKIAVIVSGYSNIADYANQTKDVVSNTFIKNDIYKEVAKLLNTEWGKGNDVLAQVVNDLVEEARVKAELEEQRKQYRKVQRATNSRKKVDKFVPSKFYRKNIVSGSEFWLLEGDSAAGAVEQARDASFQALLALKGKIINVIKNPLEKVLANEEVTNIFRLIGAGMEIPILEQTFDIEKMKFEKIIIGTDADDDGFQIRVLIFLLFYKFAPSIISEGRLYIAETPLYNLHYADKTRYALTKEHRKELEKKHGLAPTVSRNKGLGEINPQVLAETTVDPAYTEHKNLVQIKLDPTDATLYSMIDALYGKDVSKERKSIIIKYLDSDIGTMIEDNSAILNYLEEREYDEELEVSTHVV